MLGLPLEEPQCEISDIKSFTKRLGPFLSPNFEPSVKLQLPYGIFTRYLLFHESQPGTSVSVSATNFISGTLTEMVYSIEFSKLPV